MIAVYIVHKIFISTRVKQHFYYWADYKNNNTIYFIKMLYIYSNEKIITNTNDVYVYVY